jgi:N-acetylmuramoyl-L-alanine amidase
MIKPYPVLLLATLACLASCSHSTFRVLEKPVVFDEERKKLSLAYMEERHGIKTSEPTIQPRMVVLHWTAIPSLEQSYDAFYAPTLRGGRKDLVTSGNLNVSSHYLIDRDGTIFRQLPDTVFARHVIGLNYCAIGVENVGSDKSPLTRAQLKANEALIRYLKKKYAIEYVIGHYEYTLFEGESIWKETDKNYRTKKTDPGKTFMKKIRNRLKDLDLKGPPTSFQ